MAQNAYIKLVPASQRQEISTDDIKELFYYYQKITNNTTKQINWEFDHAAFPYEIKETEDGKGSWFYLKSDHPRYNAILVGVDTEEIFQVETEEMVQQTYIQITLPENATHGDRGKANEFCKFLSKKLEAELHLFNGKIMYYYKRK